MTADVIVRTAQGRLRGVQDGPALRFLGVPFAEPPDGAARFAAPVPHARWDGIRDALDYGASSPQPDRGITLIPEPVIPGLNELNLNVFTPSLGADGLPVLVWIHGGGFFGGCNASPWYRGGAFARDGVVLVSVNYRLGYSGFLEMPGAAVNRGVRDWVRALEWVQENIAAFGGDPGKVTIAGQSAGGGACATLLAVPSARGLFRAAICMSGSVTLGPLADDKESVTSKMAQHLGLAALDAQTLAALPVERVLAAQGAVLAEAAGPIASGEQTETAVVAALSSPLSLPFAPWGDGEVVAEVPIEAAARAGVPVLAGATANEFNMALMGADWITADMVRAGLAKAGMPAALAEDYLSRPGMHPGEVVGQCLTDRTFRAPAEAMAAAASPAWLYDFRWPAPGGMLAGQSFHCLDVPFVFDVLDAPWVAEISGGPAPQSLASAMHGAWVRFATEADPGWARYEPSARPVMVFADQPAVREDPLRLEREAWGTKGG